MMIRRYIVKDMPEAVVLIRKELGKDAVILNSKRITLKKWMGLWRYKRLEVLAATGDDVPVRVHGLDVNRNAPAIPVPTPVESTPLRHDVSHSTHHREVAASVATAPPRVDVSPGSPIETGVSVSSVPGGGELSQLEDVRRQIQDMKKLLENTVVTPSVRPPLVQQLLRQGVAEENVIRLMESFANVTAHPALALDVGDPASKARQRDLFVQHICSDLSDFAGPQSISPSSRFVALVGPTGVGKTTTIAKLAALHVLAGKRKVGLLTTDTFRIAAVDQLKTYANILNVPLAVVYQADELPSAIEQLSGCDLILVDTAGRNFRMDTHVQEVEELLRRISVDETYLVLSMTSKPDDLEALAGAFQSLPIDKFLFTKLDETATYGAILNLLYRYGKPLSYLTTGQNVPDDIEIASLEKLLRLIVGGAV